MRLAAFEATIPSFAFFVFAAALGTARYRPLTVAVELSALFLFLLAHQTGVRSRASAWFASRSPGGWLQVARPGLVMAAVAVVAAMLFGPSVPGASSAALLSWRNQDHNGPASRSTVKPRSSFWIAATARETSSAISRRPAIARSQRSAHSANRPRP